MKNINKLISLLLLSLIVGLVVGCNSGGSSSNSNTNSQWTWVSGSNTTNGLGVYGTQEVPSSSNIPGARFGAISWTGTDGNFWLFGGSGYDSSPSDAGNGNLNDLWKYNPTTNQWTWMKGSNINTNNIGSGTIGVYGTIGVAAPSNQPGARLCPVSWTDSHGKLWLFGGQGYANSSSSGLLNDLWQYSPDTNQWTWISGVNTTNSHGVYGTRGAATNSTQPGARLCGLSWVDSSDNLWLFGGQGYDDGTVITPGYLNDLWKYNPTTNQWTWVSGNATANVNGIYGTQGKAAPGNKPGGRIDAVGWIDNSGNLWLFGGMGEDANGTTLKNTLNDLWKYNPQTDQWTWMSGSNFSNASGVYGILGVSSANSIPGARFRKVPLSWVDNSGNLWMFGGDGNGDLTTGFLNDLWQYDASNNQWTWMGGSTESGAQGIYGTQGISGELNQPGARSDAVGWIDKDKNIWVFGGAQTSPDTDLNDLWKYSN